MSKRRWSCFLLGILVTTTTVGCSYLSKPEETEPTPRLIETTALAPDPTLTITSPPASTDTPAPAPSPTFNFAATWQSVPDAVPGWQIAIPPDWVNLTSRLEATSTTTPYGLLTMLVANSAHTEASLLARKPILEGAFVVALLADTELLTDIPQDGLAHLMALWETAVPLNTITNIRITGTTPAILASAVDVSAHPIPFFAPTNSQLRTQIVYLVLPATAPAKPEQVVFFFSAPTDQWDIYADTFADILNTFSPRVGTTASTPIRIQGIIAPPESVSGNLQKGQQDIWSLFLDESQYLSLHLKPEGNQLDLAATIIDPTGRVITNLDNGYTNSSERGVDILLPEAGRYLLAISELSKQAGSYSLDAALSITPTFAGRGEILLDETVQNQMPAEARHLWAFSGTAGQNISLVLKPLQHTLDVILNVYSPDGTRLVALDEGFSGDPEVVSGLVLPVTGTYTIVVSNFGSTGGAYALSLNRGGEQTANFYDAGDLVYGQTRRETLRINEAHAWFFQAQTGDEVRLKATPLSDNLDLDMWLIDPTINLLATADLSLAGEPEMIEQTIPTDGQYLVLVREFSGQSGSYEINLMALSASAPTYAGTLAYNSTVSSTLAVNQPAFWLFAGEEGDVVTVQVQPTTNSDLVLTLQMPDGHTALTTDETVVGDMESIDSFRLTSSGQWRVLIQEFFGDVAAYRLSVTSDQ